MNEKVLQTLEYYKIIDKLTEKAGSELPMPFPDFSGKAPLLLAAIKIWAIL